jgi:branched-chain amino acid transport system permease protein
MLAGYAGRTSLGHGAIFGASTYVVIYWTAVLGGGIWTGMTLGILCATLLAALFALLAIRTSGVYFLLLTLALGMIVWGLCLRWTSVTGGENGLRGIGRPAFIADHVSFYYAVLLVVAALTVVMWRFVHSPFGLTLRGIRDSESRMRSLGYNVPLHLFLAFVASGFFAGIAGALYALFNNFVSPSTVQLSQSVAGLLMAITGGIGTLLGSFVGATLIISMENAVSAFTARWPTVLGVTFVLIMIFAPEGVVGRAQILLARRRKRQSS